MKNVFLTIQTKTYTNYQDFQLQIKHTNLCNYYDVQLFKEVLKSILAQKYISNFDKTTQYLLHVHLYEKDTAFIYSLKSPHTLSLLKIHLMSVLTLSSSNRSFIFLRAPALPMTLRNWRVEILCPDGAQCSCTICHAFLYFLINELLSQESRGSVTNQVP